MEHNNYERMTVSTLKNLARERGKRVTLGLLMLG